MPHKKVAAIATLGPSSSGTLMTQPGSAGTYRFTVSFAKAFASIPVVVVTPLQDGVYAKESNADTFAVTVVSVSEGGFIVNVNRVDMLNGIWEEKLQLQYMAEA